MESSDVRVTFTVACPLRRLKPVPTGISSSISVGNFVFATLGGTGCCRRANPLLSERLSIRLYSFRTNGSGLLQLVTDRAVSIMPASRSPLNGTVKFTHRLVEFDVLILQVY